jgi:hypothetical protein
MTADIVLTDLDTTVIVTAVVVVVREAVHIVRSSLIIHITLPRLPLQIAAVWTRYQ